MPVAHKHVQFQESRGEMSAGKYKIYIVISNSCVIILQNDIPGPSLAIPYIKTKNRCDNTNKPQKSQRREK